jgi:hypothetical protein
MQGHAGTYRDIEGNEGECGNTGEYRVIGIQKNLGEYRLRKDVFIRENG